MSQSEIHSVILNLNKNFSNNKGYSFSTIVNKQLTLKPNTLCALYTGNIIRSPIVIDKDTDFTLELNISRFPTDRQTAIADMKTENLETEGFPNLSVEIKAGKYSKLSFCRYFCNQINNLLGGVVYQNIEVTADIEPVPGEKLHRSFPYAMFYEMKDDNFFLGLRYELQPDDPDTGQRKQEWHSMTRFQDLDDNMATSQGITKALYDLEFHREVRADNWEAFALGNSPVRGMAHKSQDLNNLLGDEIGFISCNIVATKPSAATQNQEFLFGLNNTYFSEKWGSAGNIPDEKTIRSIGVDVPQVLIGAYLDATLSTTEVTNSVLTLFCLDDLGALGLADFVGETARDNAILDDYKTLARVDLRDYNVNIDDGASLTYEVYQIQTAYGQFDDDIATDGREYYFRFIVGSPYSDTTARTCIYDSINNNIALSADLVETGYLFQQLECYGDATSATTGGLCPQFYFKNTNEDFKVVNARCNNIAWYDNEANRFNYQMGYLGYAFSVDEARANNTNPNALRNILGINVNTSQTLFGGNTVTNRDTIYDPNAFPIRKELGGLNQLESDKIRYNIELNLPVKAYNSTESEINDLGQQRTIIYNTNPVIEDVTNHSSGLVNKNLEPNDIKYLSLNNRDDIKLNSLDIKIRRAKTNELAEEITDASVELLFKSDADIVKSI